MWQNLYTYIGLCYLFYLATGSIILCTFCNVFAFKCMWTLKYYVILSYAMLYEDLCVFVLFVTRACI